MRFISTLGTAALTMSATALADVTITEIRTGSANAEYIELKGTPGASLDGYAVVIIGDGTTTGTAPTRSGVVEWLYRFAATDVIGSNGYLVLHNPGQNPNAPPPPALPDTSGAFPFTIAAGATDRPWGYQTPTGYASDTQIESPDNQTYLLVTGYTGADTFQTRAPNGGAGGQDLDTNDDGILDITPWTAIVDSVVMKETNGNTPGSGQDWWYASTLCGPYISRQVVTATSGTTVAGWDFQTTTNANAGTAAAAAPNTPKVFNSNAGVGTMYLDGANGASNWAQATELNAFTGTNVNATGTGTGGNGLDPAFTGLGTSSLALVAGGAGNPANGKSFTMKFSMTSVTGLNVSYATRTSGATSGFTTHQWAWSTDGSSWTDIDTFTPFTTSFALKSLAALNALNGAAEGYLKCTVSGAAGTSGTSNNRFDNVLLLSNAVSTDTVVTNYSGPVHGFKTSTGAWVIGVASTTIGNQDTPGADNVDPATYACGTAGAGDCAAAHNNAFCADSCCCTYVCNLDAFCCTVRWDSICATAAAGCAANCTGNNCPADFDNDNNVSGSDLGLLLGGWGGVDYDLDGDSIVSGADLGRLLGAWGPCP
ncbi:MAG: hypothetical protein FJ260_08215 [Planctomycetes bacterium]|nr:hypothetical protein [Planctomycetota bacterium]